MTPEVIKTFYNNGHRREEYAYVNGKLHGLNEQWWYGGMQKSKANYVNGNIHGVFEGWYFNGRIQFRELYINGNRNGLSEYWSTSGKLLSNDLYVNDKLLLDLFADPIDDVALFELQVIYGLPIYDDRPKRIIPRQWTTTIQSQLL